MSDRMEASPRSDDGAAKARVDRRLRRGPPLFVLSWIVWLLIFAGLCALPARRLARHQADMALGHQTRRIRLEICLKMSRPPRPDRAECLARAFEPDGDLTAPRMM